MPTPDAPVALAGVADSGCIARGVILAAGGGTRLRTAIDDEPKCLMRLGGVTMLDRQVEALRTAGVHEIAVVVGCQAERVRRTTGGGVQYIENTRFAQTNSLYSLWLARHLLLDGFVVINCDVLFHPQLLTDLLTAQLDAAALVAFDAGTLAEEEMKVKVRRGRVVEFSKQMRAEDADGENVGMVKFGAAAARALVAHLDRLVGTGHTRDWAPRAFTDFARERALHAVGTRGYPWIEIDFPEDYARARSEVLPAIEGGPARFLAARPPGSTRATAGGAATEAWPVAATPIADNVPAPVAD